MHISSSSQHKSHSPEAARTPNSSLLLLSTKIVQGDAQSREALVIPLKPSIVDRLLTSAREKQNSIAIEVLQKHNIDYKTAVVKLEDAATEVSVLQPPLKSKQRRHPDASHGYTLYAPKNSTYYC